MKENIRIGQIKFVGKLGWMGFRELLVYKMSECRTEKDFSRCLEILLASMFRSGKEIDKARKEARIKLLDEYEKKQIRFFDKR